MTQDKGKKNKCKWCLKMFASKQSKCNHQKCCKRNPERRDHNCDRCGYKTERADALKRHKITCKGTKK